MYYIFFSGELWLHRIDLFFLNPSTWWEVFVWNSFATCELGLISWSVKIDDRQSFIIACIIWMLLYKNALHKESQSENKTVFLAGFYYSSWWISFELVFRCIPTYKSIFLCIQGCKLPRNSNTQLYMKWQCCWVSCSPASGFSKGVSFLFGVPFCFLYDVFSFSDWFFGAILALIDKLCLQHPIVFSAFDRPLVFNNMDAAYIPSAE